MIKSLYYTTKHANHQYSLMTVNRSHLRLVVNNQNPRPKVVSLRQPHHATPNDDLADIMRRLHGTTELALQLPEAFDVRSDFKKAPANLGLDNFTTFHHPDTQTLYLRLTKALTPEPWMERLKSISRINRQILRGIQSIYPDHETMAQATKSPWTLHIPFDLKENEDLSQSYEDLMAAIKSSQHSHTPTPPTSIEYAQLTLHFTGMSPKQVIRNCRLQLSQCKPLLRYIGPFLL